MSQPTSNTEIKQILALTGVKATLNEPPKEFIAVLTSTTDNQTCSIKFRHPTETDSVILTLVKNLEIPISYAEHSSATLEWTIEEALSRHERNAKIPGNEIRYLDETEKKAKKGDLRWKYLDKSISIQIFASDPFRIEDDPATVVENTNILKKALMSEIEAEQAKIVAAQKRLGKLGEQLELIQ